MKWCGATESRRLGCSTSFRPRGSASIATLLSMSAPVPPGAGVQASDPARLTDGQVIPRQVVDMPTGGSFTVDLERAPQTLRELTAARDELTGLCRRGAGDSARSTPATADEVSRDAATLARGGRRRRTGLAVLARFKLESTVSTQLIDAITAELQCVPVCGRARPRGSRCDAGLAHCRSACSASFSVQLRSRHLRRHSVHRRVRHRPPNRFGAPRGDRTLRRVGRVAASPCAMLCRRRSSGTRLHRRRDARRTSSASASASWTMQARRAEPQDVRRSVAISSRDTYRTQREWLSSCPPSIEGIPAVRQKTGRGDTQHLHGHDRARLHEAPSRQRGSAAGDPAPGNDACEFAEQATALVIRKLPPQR